MSESTGTLTMLEVALCSDAHGFVVRCDFVVPHRKSVPQSRFISYSGASSCFLSLLLTSGATCTD